MRRTFIFFVAALISMTALATPERAEALGFELEGRFWKPSFSGGGGIPDVGLPPEFDFDLDSLLALDADDVFEVRGTFRIVLGFYLRAAYQTMDNSGSQTVGLGDIDLPFPIPPIDLDATLSSALDFEYGRVALGWRFVSPGKIFSAGAFVEAKGFRGDVGVAVDSLFFSDSLVEEFEGGAAAWGLTAEVNPGEKWKIFGEASWVFGDDEFNMTDIELGGRYYPTEIFGIGVGYRVMDLDGILDNVALDAQWDGVFLTAILEF